MVVADIRDEQARAVAAECAALGPVALGARVDVAEEASTRALAEAAIERFGRIDVLVNNAAIYYDLDRTENTLAYFNRVLSVNLTGAWLMSRAVERFMKRQRKGKIIHQSSTAAYLGNVGMVDTDDPEKPMPPFHYSVAKIGVAGLTKYMAGALGPWGINVNAIAPGVTMTEAARARGPDRHRRLPRLRRLRPDDGSSAGGRRRHDHAGIATRDLVSGRGGGREFRPVKEGLRRAAAGKSWRGRLSGA